jgi:hypothetical protein
LLAEVVHVPSSRLQCVFTRFVGRDRAGPKVKAATMRLNGDSCARYREVNTGNKGAAVGNDTVLTDQAGNILEDPFQAKFEHRLGWSPMSICPIQKLDDQPGTALAVPLQRFGCMSKPRQADAISPSAFESLSDALWPVDRRDIDQGSSDVGTTYSVDRGNVVG